MSRDRTLAEATEYIEQLETALAPLVDIADAYDSNSLDDDARKFWGKNSEFTNETKPQNIGLYFGRGGKELLTLKHCLDARAACKR